MEIGRRSAGYPARGIFVYPSQPKMRITQCTGAASLTRFLYHREVDNLLSTALDADEEALAVARAALESLEAESEEEPPEEQACSPVLSPCAQHFRDCHPRAQADGRRGVRVQQLTWVVGFEGFYQAGHAFGCELRWQVLCPRCDLIGLHARRSGTGGRFGRL